MGTGSNRVKIRLSNKRRIYIAWSVKQIEQTIYLALFDPGLGTLGNHDLFRRESFQASLWPFHQSRKLLPCRTPADLIAASSTSNETTSNALKLHAAEER